MRKNVSEASLRVVRLTQQGGKIIKTSRGRACLRPVLLYILLVKAKIAESEERLAKFPSCPPPSWTTWLPSVPMNTPHVDTETLGFPTGYFSIKSVATGRLLEIHGNETKDSSPLALWPVKEQSLVESMSARPSILLITFVSHLGHHNPHHISIALRSPDADNQVCISICRTNGSPPHRVFTFAISHRIRCSSLIPPAHFAPAPLDTQ